ncbi:CHASE domain-containing protein [Cyanobium sp. NIES-981]|uniref:CHASE domain-containing protein n=1 Tax=Cyanobium sp. NIES-981 TaxID=1851505 RepID=UPI0007DE0B66
MPDAAPRPWLRAAGAWQIDRLATAVLLSGLLATAAITELTRRFGAAGHSRQERALLTQVSDAIRARLEVNAAALASVVALFNASSTVTREEFGRFYATLSIPVSGRDAVNGMQGMGFARFLTPAERQPFEARMRAGGFPGFRVLPAGPRPEYTAIEFLEPANRGDRQAFGFDMLTTPVLRQAMQAAARSGSATLSAALKLQQGTLRQNQPGVVLFMPIRRERDTLLGWAYAPVGLKDLFEGVLASVNQAALAGATVRVIDRSGDGEATLLYSNLSEGGMAGSSRSTLRTPWSWPAGAGRCR